MKKERFQTRLLQYLENNDSRGEKKRLLISIALGISFLLLLGGCAPDEGDNGEILSPEEKSRWAITEVLNDFFSAVESEDLENLKLIVTGEMENLPIRSIYEARVTLRLDYSGALVENGEEKTDWKRLIEEEIERIIEEDVFRAVVDRLQLWKSWADPEDSELLRTAASVAVLAERLRIERGEEERTISISFRYVSPQLAADITNSVAKEYVRIRKAKTDNSIVPSVIRPAEKPSGAVYYSGYSFEEVVVEDIELAHLHAIAKVRLSGAGSGLELTVKLLGEHDLWLVSDLW